MGNPTRNEITGQQIKTKSVNSAYRKNYDDIDWSVKNDRVTKETEKGPKSEDSTGRPTD